MVILDFDGTLTDAELEGVPYREGYLNDVAILAGEPVEDVLRLAEKFEREVQKREGEFGWKYGGEIVAPASVDPYLRMMPVARMIFDHYAVFMDSSDRDRLLDGILYRYNYPRTRTVFRKGAEEVLKALPKDATWVVTNSHTAPVQNKIRTLGQSAPGQLDWLVDRVHGNARKYVVDPDFSQVETSLQLPGLARPILLRRSNYHAVLDALREEAGAEWSEMLVIGDIFELDLSLPLAMGASVCLLVNPFTPGYEKNFLEKHPRGHVIHDLAEIIALAAS
jgi:FMN phosphatase YigB (HAD superfamily)